MFVAQRKKKEDINISYTQKTIHLRAVVWPRNCDHRTRTRTADRWPRRRVVPRDFPFAGIVGLSGVAPVMVARHAGYPRSQGPGVIHREPCHNSDGRAGRGRSAAARCRTAHVPFLPSASRPQVPAGSARSHLHIYAGSGAGAAVRRKRVTNRSDRVGGVNSMTREST